MFENKNEPQDIFDGVEPPANLPVGGAPTPAASLQAPASVPTTPAVPRPVMQGASVTPPPVSDHLPQDRYTGQGGHLWKTIVIVVIAFVAMGGAAFLSYRLMNPNTDVAEETRDGATRGDSNEQATEPDGKGDSQPVAEDKPDVELVLDNDGDGLTNAEEQAAGTDVSKPDTDGDLLGDREEVQVYGTNPLMADTDSDSFPDGQEVRSGYNPKGEGKLLEIPSAQ